MLGLILFGHSKYSFVHGRMRAALTAILILCVILFYLPNIARADDNVQALSQTLDKTNKLLKLSKTERYIELLESESERTVSIPDLVSGDPYLKVYPVAEKGTISYDHSLAALYFADARPGAAVDTIVKSLQNIDQNSVLPSREYEAALNGIRFLIEQRRISDATAGIERLASATSAYDRLLQLLQITKKHKLLSSGDTIRQSLEADAKSTRSVDTLLKIVSGLKSAEEPELAEAVVKQAKHRARTDEEVFELGRYYLNSGETSQAEEMFERILGGSPPLNIVEKVYAVSKEGNLHGPEKASLQSLVLRLQVADKRFDSYLAAALKARDTEAVSYGIKKVYEADGLGDKYEAFIDKLVHYDVPDYVRMAYEIPLAGIGANDPERQEEMQFIVDSALKRKLYDIAAKALYKLAVYLAGDIDKYRVVPPGILHDGTSCRLRKEESACRLCTVS